MSETAKLRPAEAESGVPSDREVLLTARGLTKHFPVKGGFPFKRTVGAVRAVDNVDLTVHAGEAFGLVGESGCGKSTTGRLLTRLLEPTSGSIKYRGREIAHASRKELAPIRSEIQMIFQDPYSSLNPRQTVGTIIGGPMEINGINPPGGREKRVRELLEIVGLNPEHYNRFPHEFSGGQRQRIGVARALALEPKLIVADEPVSALDVSIQAQVVNLLQRLQREMGIAFVFIAHDLAVVRHFSERVAVMYLGKIVEVGDRESIYTRPRHPYTHALLSAVPEASLADGDGERRERIRLSGDVPSPVNPPSGCRFRTRCWKAQEKCATEEPPLVQLAGNREGHLTACHFPEEGTVTGRAEAVVMDAALAAMEKDGKGTGAGKGAKDPEKKDPGKGDAGRGAGKDTGKGAGKGAKDPEKKDPGKDDAGRDAGKDTGKDTGKGAGKDVKDPEKKGAGKD